MANRIADRQGGRFALIFNTGTNCGFCLSSGDGFQKSANRDRPQYIVAFSEAAALCPYNVLARQAMETISKVGFVVPLRPGNAGIPVDEGRNRIGS